ncbi:MAG TPA: PEGA domain-containing protein, partial [Polyangiales bacterium]|nr:PEGA domain-containing protein [Polyangiales bacterium]
RSANTQAQYAPAHLNRTANTQARNTSAHLNRSANTQVRNAPVHLNRTANAQLNRSVNWQGNRAATGQLAPRPAAFSFVDDEPVSYPKPRSSGWLKTFALLLCVAAGAYAARDLIAPAFLTTPAPRPQPTPVAPPTPAPSAIPEPAASTPAPEALAAPTPAPEPTPQDDAKARRSAARAAIIAERWRERRAARHASGEYAADTDDRSDTTASEPAQPPRYTHKAVPEPGILRINSRPWSNIFVDGQPVGHTPQMNLQLPAGQHQITLINNEMQLRKAINVMITPGQTTTQTVNLAE